ncbi:Ig-like domain-containing protein [Solobacterium moorei]|uniref:Ig-like domain-containing protein n=1 Tax=Solobacterium moorei TaxID=102148 RepID=UPI0028D401B3|nr:Ig-like domain-containing protein [Solobacterium moorei]
MHAKAALDNLHIQYKWDKDEDRIQYGYLKADFTTSENIGLRNGMYKELYGDFSKLNPKDFISTVQNIFQSKQEVLTDTITLCTVKIPLPNAPMVSVVMKINLNLYATGKAELSFVQNHVVGCEIRNGNMRIISDHSKKATASIRAETGITLGTNLSLHAFNQNVMDAEVDAGAKGYFKTRTYLYNEEGKVEPYDIDIQPDLVEELSEGNPNVKVCTELNAYWLCNLKLNSSNSLAGRFGFGRNIAILNESNAPLFPKGKVTYENWMSVDHCSCEDREKVPNIESIQVKKRITLKDYSLIAGVGVNTRIQVSGLPEGYTVEDLVYTSQNTDIAEVSSVGEVIGKRPGGTDILIQTKDKKHLVHCHILVVEINRK